MMAAVMIYLLKIRYNYSKENSRLRQQLAEAQETTDAGADEPQVVNEVNTDNGGDLKAQVLYLSDRVEYLGQCLLESENKALEYKYETKIDIGAKRDLSKEIVGLKRQWKRQRQIGSSRVPVSGCIVKLSKQRIKLFLLVSWLQAAAASVTITKDVITCIRTTIRTTSTKFAVIARTCLQDMDDAIYEHQCPFTVLRHVRSDSIAPFVSINSLYDAQAWENGKAVLRTSMYFAMCRAWVSHVFQ